jgi:hypothetical protein
MWTQIVQKSTSSCGHCLLGIASGDTRDELTIAGSRGWPSSRHAGILKHTLGGIASNGGDKTLEVMQGGTRSLGGYQGEVSDTLTH